MEAAIQTGLAKPMGSDLNMHGLPGRYAGRMPEETVEELPHLGIEI